MNNQNSSAVSNGRKNIFNRIIDHISNCMGPVIPYLIAGGLVKLIGIILSITGLCPETTSTSQIISLIGDAPLYFLPFFAASTAALEFHVNPIAAMVCVGCMLSPSFVAMTQGASSITFLGIPVVKATYAYSTIPVILLVAAMHYVEKLVHRILPKVVDDVLAPLLILLLGALLGLIVIGPLGTLFGNVLAEAMKWLQHYVPVLAWALLCGLLGIFVITGIHWIFVALALSQLGLVGIDDGYMVAFFILTMVQAGACLAVFLRAKKIETKKIAMTAGLTTFLTGVTEPSFFGVTLKYRRPLITSMIAGAIGGAYQGLVTIHCYVYAFPGLPSFLMFQSAAEPGNLAKAMIAAGISFAASFLLTFLFGWDPKLEAAQAK